MRDSKDKDGITIMEMPVNSSRDNDDVIITLRRARETGEFVSYMLRRWYCGENHVKISSKSVSLELWREIKTICKEKMEEEETKRRKKKRLRKGSHRSQRKKLKKRESLYSLIHPMSIY